MSHALLTGIARTSEPRTMLRRFLGLDAVVTGANGLAYAVASAPLGRLLGVDAGFLLGVGLFLLVYAAAVGALAAQARPSAAGVKLIVDANVLWAVLSVVAPAVWLQPSTVGMLWIPAQAVVVAAFAALQWTALRADGRR
ncbi:hypothetical protein I3F58_25555 [Streptomyces sp. MUM 203J]|uniref:hypothetical protein n=1 Tax=Streptomyces sp. MUM 203J TaxID=2791990 RepID=UPI001F04BAB2|nr:hypothetical protein [Streptomyces sp. MUM 203J]MCH0542863.1 hypothetical protein [Streptomyces sp. MUM 203J]